MEETKFAEWEVIFQPPVSTQDIQHILDFATGLLKAGQDEEVYQVNEDNNAVSTLAGTYLAIAELWKTMWEQSGVLPLFDLRINETWNWINNTSGRICYFDNTGKTNNAVVNNLGAFLKTLNPEDTNVRDSFMEDAGPLTITSNSIHKKDMQESNGKARKPLIFNISLRTDIWFPTVLGLSNNQQDYSQSQPKWYDNHDLATCHTPRLNKFLNKVNQLTLNTGGEWKLNEAEGIAEHYQAMVKESSILL